MHKPYDKFYIPLYVLRIERIGIWTCFSLFFFIREKFYCLVIYE